jgi:cell shape-determining protein MreC
MLDDPDWPKNLQNRRIGKVVSIDKRKDAPLYAEIRIRPESDLKKLKEVMVLTRN